MVIIQTNLLNQLDHPSTLILPISSQLTSEENILRVRLSIGKSGLEKDSEILIDQIRALDNRRFLEKLGSLEAKEITELRRKLRAILDF